MKLKKVLVLLVICALAITAFACTTDSGNSSDPVVVEITLSDTEVTLIKGQSQTITATVKGSDQAPEWLTSDSSVATVSGGTITAVSAGTADISAKIGEVSAVCKVRVKDTVNITVDKDELTLNATTWTDSQNTVFGKTYEKVTAVLEVGGEATQTAVTYRSLKADVATVSADGTVTALKIGSATIEASAEYQGETYKTNINVTVKKVDVDSIEAFTFGGDKNEWVIDVTRFGLTPEEVSAIYYKESGEDYVQIDLETGEIIYDGNNAKVITDGIDIDSKTQPDDVVIETDSLLITIHVAYVTENNIKFVSEVSPMVIGDSKQFKLFASGVEVSANAEWSVDKEYIATITDEGIITAVNYGTVVITAKVYGYTYTTTQVVLKEKEVPASNSTEWTVKMLNDDGSALFTKHGWRILTHGEFAVGDWVSFDFTPEIDLEAHQVFVYYGVNYCEPKDIASNYPKGIAYAIMGSKQATAKIFDDSSFIVLDGEGNKLGSIASGTGAGAYKAGKTYTVFVKIPDDGSVDHDIYIKFSSERHIEESVVYNGVVSWRDNLNDLDPAVYPANVKGFVYNGETKGEVINLDRTLTFKASELDTKNTISLADLGISGEIVGANVIGARGEFIVKNENGVPVVENGNLTIANNFLTKAGTNGVKTFEIELDKKKYVLKLEVVAIDEKAKDAAVLMAGEADKVLVTSINMVSDIKAGNNLVMFDFYASAINTDASENGAYLYMQIGARHVYLMADQAYIYSDWDNSRKEYLTANFIKVFDDEGNLVTDTLTWKGSKMYGTVQNSMQANRWYKVFVDMDGRAWNDELCTGEYASLAHVMAKTVNSNAYIANVRTCSPAEIDDITIQQTEINLADDGEETLIVNVSSVLQGAKITFKSSDETVATVDEDGVVKARKAGVAVITATVMGKEATVTVKVSANLAAQEGSRTKLTTAISTWLPNTFDKANDFTEPFGVISNANVNPAYIPGEDFGDFNMLEVSITMKEGAQNGYLHIYEYQGQDSSAWTPVTVRSTVIGKDAYVEGYKDGVIAPVAAFNELRIFDETDGNKQYRQSAIDWQVGHTYKVLIALHGNNSVGFWFTSSVLCPDGVGANNGVYTNWYMPNYALNVLSIVTFGDFYGAYRVNGSSVSLTSDYDTVTVGDTLQLTATAEKIVDKTITYKSSNENVATVSNSGLVTAVGTGTAVITATNAEGMSASKTITVTPESGEMEVTLMLNGGEYDKITVQKGEVITAPVAPEFLGYNFLGWYRGETVFDFATAINGNLVLEAKYELAEAATSLGDATKYAATKTEYMVKGGHDIVSNHATGKNYITFKFRTYTEMTEADLFYLQVGARHISIGKDNTAFISYWDVSNRDNIPADAVCIYDENGTLVRDTVLWSANGNVNNGTVEEGTVNGVLEAGKTYTVVVNTECRAWNDATMNTAYNGGTFADLDDAGIRINACGGLLSAFEYLGFSAKEE